MVNWLNDSIIQLLIAHIHFVLNPNSEFIGQKLVFIIIMITSW